MGFVIDGTFRDSYESIMQKTPAFCTVRSPAHPMGRIGPVSDNKPIVCAGVVVNPGDVVFGDDDGVVVVPQDIADEVARRARLIQEKDIPGRKAGYEALGIPLDVTDSTPVEEAMEEIYSHVLNMGAPAAYPHSRPGLDLPR